MTSRPGQLLVVLVAAAALAGCSLGGGDDEVAGGEADLPGTVPAGVTFAPPPASALTAPDFSAELVDGTPVTASDLWNERPVVLVFTASWCDRCAVIHEDVAAAVDERDGAVALLGIVPADDEGGADYAERVDLGHPVVVADDRIWLSYAAREPGVVVLVAKGGKVMRGWPAGIDRETLAEQLDELFASTP